jgi:predicted LPLAT superfamily acyltransferase
VPKARLYGRYLSHIFVWLETLSFAIGDSMCGFRLYPIDATAAIMVRNTLPARMDFDTEVVVRLYWRGTPIEELRTPVIYPQDGLSHFDMLRDNWRITKMHTRLSFGMLPRLPTLLARKSRAAARSAHWSRLSERGGVWGMRFVYGCYRLLGIRGTHLLLYPIVFYFLLAAPRARRASIAYLKRVKKFEGLPEDEIGWRDAFRHLHAFAQSSLDKLAAWMGKIDSQGIDFPQREAFEILQQSGRGALLIGAHLGNLEMLRAVATGEGLARVNAVVYTDHARRFNEILRDANSDFDINLIQVRELGPDTAMLLKDKIEAGELLVIVGDRTPPAENGRVACVPFLGNPACFPQGPYILAALLDCPVYLFFCLRESGRYRIHFELFAQKIDLPRKTRTEQLDTYARRYAERLQMYCLRAPYQWFNFYNFWREGARTTK